jgi:predicted transcriptional regulator
MKAILMSIRPQWVAKILNGEKTVEIRKTAPNVKVPIDVYIYCTKGKYEMGKFNSDKKYHEIRDDCCYAGGWSRGLPDETINGKVVAKFTLNKVEEIKDKWFSQDICETDELSCVELERKSCLYSYDIHKYLKDKTGYAWHIDNLEIFDNPRPLQPYFDLNRPPQSWQYIWENDLCH